jgi:asparagine synthase (glutamine-hydrolysing)
MCGLVGIVGRVRTAVPDPIGSALSVLARRGPDLGGRATGTLGRHPLEFGVRRLGLVAPHGVTVPWRAPGGGLLGFNGEIYNHEELRARLERDGHRSPVGPGDGHVLAAWLEAHGLAGLPALRGSYAFAFCAGPDGPLWLARDPVGVRPLAYARVPGGLVFASTLDGLVALGAFPPAPDVAALVDVLRDGVIPTERTALEGVRRVPPGQVLAFDVHLTCAQHVIPLPVEDGDEGGLDVVGALRAAVADRLRLDRPVGLLLSGGIDSGLIAALAAEVERLPTYTVSYPGVRAADEVQRARATARRLDLPHHVVPCPLDPTAWVVGTARAFDEPFADASAVPTWGVAREAGRRVRALLTGTGGDELFGGYRRYWMLGHGPWLRHVPAFMVAPVRRVLDRRAPGSLRVLRAASDPEGLYRGLLRLQPLTELRTILGPLLRTVAEPTPRPGPRTAAEAMRDDIRRYLPDDLLVKEDRALMAHGVEGRHPFLDSRVRHAAQRIEIHGSPFRGRQKALLRAYVREHVDADLARAPKRGFAFPVDELYRGPLRDLAESCLLDGPGLERGFLHPEGVRRLYREHLCGARNAGAVIHALVMLELWSRRVLDGQPTVT